MQRALPTRSPRPGLAPILVPSTPAAIAPGSGIAVAQPAAVRSGPPTRAERVAMTPDEAGQTLREDNGRIAAGLSVPAIQDVATGRVQFPE